jgi:hypothetical protein
VAISLPKMHQTINNDRLLSRYGGRPRKIPRLLYAWIPGPALRKVWHCRLTAGSLVNDAAPGLRYPSRVSPRAEEGEGSSSCSCSIHLIIQVHRPRPQRLVPHMGEVEHAARARQEGSFRGLAYGSMLSSSIKNRLGLWQVRCPRPRSGNNPLQGCLCSGNDNAKDQERMRGCLLF